MRNEHVRLLGRALGLRRPLSTQWQQLTLREGFPCSVYGRLCYSSSTSSSRVGSDVLGHSVSQAPSRRLYKTVATGGALGLAGVCYGFLSWRDAGGMFPVASADAETETNSLAPDPVSGESGKPNAAISPEDQELVNWSGTHQVKTRRYFQPESLDELRAVVSESHETGAKLRPVGSALSPNALAFNEGGMVNLALMDSILSIDKEKRQVMVQAGARVSQVVDALRPHGLTLQNYASIAEQQIGGFIQVGAHGTGASIPPVDEQVLAIKLITPGAGEVVLSSSDEDPMLFKLARTSLGLLGIVAEVTLQCVDAHSLVEHTFVTSRAGIRANHSKWLRENKHLRYMWIPHTDAVVVVTCNPVNAESAVKAKTYVSQFSEEERLQPARNLLKGVPNHPLSHEKIDDLSFTSLRDELLAVDPLDTAWVRKVNEVEAEFWRRSEGLRVDTSDRVLGFDCGGQQWVSEVAFPVPTASETAVDIDFVESVLNLIDERQIPAPSPIEQRWTAPSSSPMSPACERPEVELAPLYSWVGIIMYLPETSSSASDISTTRAAITTAFQKYKEMCEAELWGRFRAVEHWAKIELPENQADLDRLRARTTAKYPVAAFDAIRRHLFDPKGILSNNLTEAIFMESRSD